MKITLKQLIDTELPYQIRRVVKAEEKVLMNPIRQGENFEETQEQNTYNTDECVIAYFAHLNRLESLKRIRVKNSLQQMLLITQQQDLKAEITFYKKIVLPSKVFTRTKFDENKNPIVTKHNQFYTEMLNPTWIDNRVEELEATISTIQQQINQLNAETFVEVPDRI